MDDHENEDTAPELDPFEVVCPVCNLTFHGPLLACPTCQENKR